MKTPFVPMPWRWTALCAAALLAACSSSPRQPAPVEDRSATARTLPPAASSPVDPKTLPGAENAGKPGYYTVQKGDTLMRIALEHGQAWRDVARWNSIVNPDLIEVGQVLRVVPPGAQVEASGVVVRPITAPAEPVRPAASAPASSTAPQTTGSNAAGDELLLSWPAQGPVVAGFDEVKNKGLDIAGKAGDAVLAAADGQVVYAGAGLRGYGNLVILKHNNNYLTAYAHNQKLLVKEDQRVKRGEKIAEMGSTDTDRVKLHFEVRRQGKPVDPTRFLAAR